MRSTQIALVLGLWASLAHAGEGAALSHWQDTASKQAIVEFVDRVTTPGSPQFVAEADRIAAFDNDGTLWAEKPLYFPVMFALEQLRAQAPRHPEWATTEPYKSLLQSADGSTPLSHEAMRVLQEQVFAGITPQQFSARVDQWLAKGVHPQQHQPYRALTYVPMQELLAYLRAHGFTVVLTSGAETEFVRSAGAWLYQVPAALAIGSDIAMVATPKADGSLQLLRAPAFLLPFNERGGKPVNLHRRLGQRPLLAFGNSNGDIELLQAAAGGPGPGLALLLHHDDAAREYLYDGGAEEALREASRRGWQVVSMQRDFRQVFAHQATGE